MTPHQSSNNKTTFYELAIAPKLLETLDRLKFKTPTPIQNKAIPIAIEGNDLIGIAQTGTGKTLAFGIPMLQRLAQKNGRGLVLVPTRELAIQVSEAIQKISHPFNMRTAVLIGGASFITQIMDLRKNPRVLIATPGRLIDLMNRQHIRLDDVVILVLDEADRMLDMGFAPQIERILKNVQRDRQTMLFSATMPQEIVKIAATHMKLPVRVEIARAGTTAEKVTHELFFVKKEEKPQLLSKVLAQYHGSVLIFCRTRHGTRKTAKLVRNMGYNSAEIHSDRTLGQRREALEGFKSGRHRVLAATDIAARGIDVIGIELVINYDLPDEAENYVHRVGRTGRAGHPGHAITFAYPEQRKEVRAIENLIRVALPVSKHHPNPENIKTSPIQTKSQH